MPLKIKGGGANRKKEAFERGSPLLQLPTKKRQRETEKKIWRREIRAREKRQKLDLQSLEAKRRSVSFVRKYNEHERKAATA